MGMFLPLSSISMYLDSWSSLFPHDFRFFSLSLKSVCGFISWMTCIFLLLTFTLTKLNWKNYLSWKRKSMLFQLVKKWILKPNSIPQNWVVRWALHPLIYSKSLSLVDVRLPTHPLTSRYIHLVCGTRH